MPERRPMLQQQLIDRINMCQRFETIEPGTLQEGVEPHKEVYVRLNDVIDVIDAFHGIVRVPQGAIMAPPLEWSEE